LSTSTGAVNRTGWSSLGTTNGSSCTIVGTGRPVCSTCATNGLPHQTSPRSMSSSKRIAPRR
jgi:hypothetical protein